MSRPPRALPALTLLLLALGAGACSEDSPGGRELVRPAEREAAPVSEPGLERTEAERREERLEHFGVDEPERREERLEHFGVDEPEPTDEPEPE